ncbi:MAG TPA: hypothetical protein VFF06_06850 [Polyangia bacterium]|nr:hypothetical protein [Polyangia bacterium]
MAQPAVAPTVERTLRAKHDLDWLPPHLKALRWAVAGSLWTGLAGLVAAIAVFAKYSFIVYGKGLAVLAAGGYYAGDRAARAVLRRRLHKLARGDVDLSSLKSEADGELVHVRGRVRARETLRGFLTPETAVYRRMVFAIGNERWVHEAAVDFLIVDGGGEAVLVEVTGARLVAADAKRKKLEGAQAGEVLALSLGTPRLEAGLTIKEKNRAAITAGEVLVRDGDEIEIVGYKSRSVDLTVEARLMRDTPIRTSLRAGRELPLLIAIVSA